MWIIKNLMIQIHQVLHLLKLAEGKDVQYSDTQENVLLAQQFYVHFLYSVMRFVVGNTVLGKGFVDVSHSHFWVNGCSKVFQYAVYVMAQEITCQLTMILLFVLPNASQISKC